MNAEEQIKIALQAIAQREVPETTNLWPQIVTHLEHPERPTMKLMPRIVWMMVWLLIALALISGVAYALYNYFRGDAGMEAVDQAGLISELNITAMPTPLPTATPVPTPVPLGKSQAWNGVTITLNWIYLTEMWQAIGFSVSGLSESQRVGIPSLAFDRIQPLQYSGAGMLLSPAAQGLEGRYVVHQIVRDDSTMAEDVTDVNIEIPLLAEDGSFLTRFRFSAPRTVIHQLPYGGGNTYAIRMNGLEMSLEWVVLTPTETRVKLCYELPDESGLKIEQASLRSAEDFADLLSVSSESLQRSTETTLEGDRQCEVLLFPAMAPESRNLVLSVPSLRGADGGQRRGPWEFTWSEMPWQRTVPGIDKVGTQSAGEVTVTLLQAYADALRVAVVYQLSGTSPDQSASLVELLDPQGKLFNTSQSITQVENDPTTFIASLSFSEPPTQKIDSLSLFSQRQPVVDGRFVGKLKITLNPWQPEGSQVFLFDLDLPAYPPLVLTPAQSVLSAGLEMRLEKLEITPSFTNVYLCYQKPSAADWMPSHQATILQIGQASAPISDYMLLLDEDYELRDRPEWATLTGKVRCVKMGFPIGHHARPEKLILTLDELEQSVPEVIPEDQLQAALQNLRQQGIEMDWVTFQGNGGGGAGPVIKHKPEGMSDEEVLRRFYQALGYYFQATWAFEVELEP